MEKRYRNIALATVTLLAALGGCGGDKTSGNGNDFRDIDAFVASRAVDAGRGHKVVFIGIDGAGWEFMDPLIEAGKLPNLARIKKEGVYGTLRSVPVYMSPPAWATMFTGYLPEHNGVYAFGRWDPVTHEFTNTNALDLEVPQAWDVASYAGRKVAVVNVPMTFPAHPVNGLMVTGLMTPVEHTERIELGPSANRTKAPDHRIRSYSEIKSTTLDNELNTFLFSLYDTVDDGVERYDQATVVVLSKAPGHEGEHLGSYHLAVGGFSPWVRIHAMRNGQIEYAWCKTTIKHEGGGYPIGFSRAFFQINAPYTYPDTLANVLEQRLGYYLPSIFMPREMVSHITELAAQNAMLLYETDRWDLFCYVFTQSDNIHHVEGFDHYAVEVYQIIDDFIGRLMERLPEDATLIIGSDHGFAEYTWGIDLNQYLAGLGLLKWKDEGVIDFDKTLVFHNLWYLYFNHELITREELARRGLEVPESVDPVEWLEDYVSEAAKHISAGERTFPVDIERMPAGAVGDPPDMFVHGTYSDYGVDHWNLKEPHPEAVRRMAGTDSWWHKRDGVWLMWGAGVKQGQNAGVADIQDMTPTILYLLGLPLAADLDGTIIDGALGDALATRERYTVHDYDEVVAARTETEVDREDLEKKLRSLGYVR